MLCTIVFSKWNLNTLNFSNALVIFYFGRLTRALSFITPHFLVERQLPPIKRLVTSIMCSRGMPHVFSSNITLLSLMLSLFLNKIDAMSYIWTPCRNTKTQTVVIWIPQHVYSEPLAVFLSCIGRGNIKLTNVMKVVDIYLRRKKHKYKRWGGGSNPQMQN